MIPRNGSSFFPSPACTRVPDLKASPLEQACGEVFAMTALSPARPLEAKAMDVTRTETFVSGALGAVMLAGGLVLAAALLLAPGAARAVNDCGALNSGNSFTENCPDAAYTGIVYWDQPNAVTLTVPGTATTATITAGANNGLHNGITIRTNDDTTSPRTSPVRNIALTVGGTGTFVAIAQSGTRASSWYNNRGILVFQRDGDGATTTLDIKGGVTIGTAADKMENRGIEVRTFESDAGAVTVESGAAIYSEEEGIYVEYTGAAAATVTNSGAIETDGRGIFVDHTGSAGAVTVTSSGAITSAATTNDEGIFARTTGKDADGDDAGVSVTHSAGAITVASGGVGIKAEVGAARREGDASHDDYVAPMNAGLAKVSVTGGSINAKQGAIQARNYEAGSVEVMVSEGVTLASTEGHGIEALLTDVGNAAGSIMVTNEATITAGTRTTISAGMTTRTVKHGINVNRAAGSGAVSVTNRGGAVTADGYGISAVARGAGGTVSVTNSGTLGTAEDRVSRGIFISHQGTGATGAVTVANSGAIASSGDGIFARMTGKDAADANAGVTVTHSAGAIDSADGRGIKVHVGEARQETDTSHDDYVAPRNRGLLKVEVTGGSIDSKWEPIEAYNYEAGSVEIRVDSGVTLTSEYGHGIWGGLTDAGGASGTITIDNAGTIRVPKSGITFAIGAGSGDITVNNRGALEVGGDGIFAVARAAVTGDISVTNSGAIGKADARVRRGIFASHDGTGATGGVTIANSGDIMATKQGILAQTKFLDADGADDEVTVTHSAGTINVTDDGRVDSDKQGIVARVGNWRQERDSSHADYVAPKNTGAVKISVTGGTIAAKGSAVEGANYEAGNVEINVAKGVTLSSTHEHAIEADLRDVGNAGGTITVTQAGTISASGDGISAKVTRRDAATAERVIDIVWTGTFTALEGERVSPRNVARALEAAQARRAVEEANIRFARGSAGIDAGVMKWQTFMRPVSEGDDPGAFADMAAQNALFAADADAATKARAEAIIEQFRSVLTDETLGTIPGADAIDTDNDDEYSDAEIVAYLSEDDDARRTLLRNVLTQSFDEHEKAVFEAVLTGGDVEAALAAAPAGYGDAWKTGVRALLAHHNDGDIRIAMNAGSIASSGDGIRAFFGRTHDDNGAIRVDVAEGATVTGGMAGIYVENAGHGLRIEKKYTSPEIQNQEANRELGADAMVTLEDHLNQVVRVDGTVTGGADAAVHLAGGGALIVSRTGKLVGGSSGRAILVNDPGPAVIYIDGEATGGEGATAAVHLTGGGRVTLGLNGRVRANGADSAIRRDNEPVAVVFLTDRTVGDLTRGGAREVLARVEGGIVGDGGGDNVTIAETEDGVTTGHARRDLPVVEGEVDLNELPPDTFRCVDATDGRCRLYEALPSILLAMNDLPSYAERTAAARDAHGAWARVEMARGEWQADSSTRPNVTYDHRRTGGRAGVDFIAGETSRVGVSVHALRGKAEMAGVGEAELDGRGAGLSATWLVGDLYVDVQAGATWYDAELDSATGRRLVDEVDGRGYALGLDVGNRMVMGEDLVVTPRAGLAWSKVDWDDFMDEVGSRAKVSVRRARSTKGRVGVMVDTAVGSEDAPGRVFGSVDVEHEFSDETSVDVSGNLLETTVKPTGVRLGLGGEFSLGEDVVLRARADYTTSGGDTSEYGGGLELNLRF